MIGQLTAFQAISYAYLRPPFDFDRLFGGLVSFFSGCSRLFGGFIPFFSGCSRLFGGFIPFFNGYIRLFGGFSLQVLHLSFESTIQKSAMTSNIAKKIKVLLRSRSFSSFFQIRCLGLAHFRSLPLL